MRTKNIIFLSIIHWTLFVTCAATQKLMHQSDQSIKSLEQSQKMLQQHLQATKTLKQAQDELQRARDELQTQNQENIKLQREIKQLSDNINKILSEQEKSQPIKGHWPTYFTWRNDVKLALRAAQADQVLDEEIAQQRFEYSAKRKDLSAEKQKSTNTREKQQLENDIANLDDLLNALNGNTYEHPNSSPNKNKSPLRPSTASPARTVTSPNKATSPKKAPASPAVVERLSSSSSAAAAASSTSPQRMDTEHSLPQQMSSSSSASSPTRDKQIPQKRYKKEEM